MTRPRIINIPHTGVYGWELTNSGSRVFRPTKKTMWNRIRFIIETRGGTLERLTTGFRVHGVELSEADVKLIREEMALVGVVEVPEDIQTSKEGREEPNLGEG